MTKTEKKIVTFTINKDEIEQIIIQHINSKHPESNISWASSDIKWTDKHTCIVNNEQNS